ncbi:DUF4411 family protein [Labrys sp. LIt4]|nr:DUF4411 family protein [Labrys sp. LIt4]
MYLLDANVLITANNSYYPVEVVPEFWSWLSHMGATGHIKMPRETMEEVQDGGDNEDRDPLFAWIQQPENRSNLLLNEEVDVVLVQQVLERYAPDLTDDEIEQIGRDPFLIAYGLSVPADRWVVSAEVSSPRKQRQNRKVPDVCRDVGVNCCDTFGMLRALRFTTRWAP